MVLSFEDAQGTIKFMDRYCRKCERRGRQNQEHFEFDYRFTENAQSFAVAYANQNGGEYQHYDEIPPRELVDANNEYWSDHSDENEGESFHIYPTDAELNAGNGRGGHA